MSFHHSNLILDEYYLLAVISSFLDHSDRISSFGCHSIIPWSFWQDFIIRMSFHHSLIILIEFYHSVVIPTFWAHLVKITSAYIGLKDCVIPHSFQTFHGHSFEKCSRMIFFYIPRNDGNGLRMMISVIRSTFPPFPPFLSFQIPRPFWISFLSFRPHSVVRGSFELIRKAENNGNLQEWKRNEGLK